MASSYVGGALSSDGSATEELTDDTGAACDEPTFCGGDSPVVKFGTCRLAAPASKDS